MRRALTVLTVLGLGLGMACGGGGDGGDGGAEAAGGGTDGIGVEGNEYSFEPEEITADPGELKITLENTGKLEHDITFDNPKLKISVLAGQKKTGSAEFEAGTYDFYCSVAGHKAAGMTGTLTVE